MSVVDMRCRGPDEGKEDVERAVEGREACEGNAREQHTPGERFAANQSDGGPTTLRRQSSMPASKASEVLLHLRL